MPKLHDEKPRLVNRGAAGLVSKHKTADAQVKEESQVEREDRIMREAPKNRIAPSLKPLIVDIASLQPDPQNARLHPERNLRAVMLSLAQSGQRKPLSVNREGMIVMAGNGTLEAAKALGWSKIAAAVDNDLDEAGWVSYGLADNRSAELARWDFETVARLDKMVSSAGLGMVGWSIDELEVLRAADWTPPEVSEEEVSQGAEKLTFSDKQRERMQPAIDFLLSALPEGSEETDAEAITLICEGWMAEIVGKEKLQECYDREP